MVGLLGEAEVEEVGAVKHETQRMNWLVEERSGRAAYFL